MRAFLIVLVIIVLGVAGALFVLFTFFHTAADLKRFDQSNPPAIRHIRQMAEAMSAGNYTQMCEYAPAIQRVDWGQDETPYFGCSNYRQLFVFEHCPTDYRQVVPVAPEDRSYELYQSGNSGKLGFDRFCRGGGDLEEDASFSQAGYFEQSSGRRLIGPCSDEDRGYGCSEIDEIASFVNEELGYASYGDFLAEVAFMHLVNEQLEAALVVRSRMLTSPGVEADLLAFIDDLIRQAVWARLSAGQSRYSDLKIWYARTRLQSEVDAVFDDWVSLATSQAEQGLQVRLPDVSAEALEAGTPLFCTYSFSSQLYTGVGFAVGKFVGDPAVFPLLFADLNLEVRRLFQRPGEILNGSVEEPRVLTVDAYEVSSVNALLVPTIAGIPDMLAAREISNVSDVRSWDLSTDARRIFLSSDWFPHGNDQERDQFLRSDANLGDVAFSLPRGGLEAALAELDNACPH